MAKFYLHLLWVKFIQVINLESYLYSAINFHEICKNWLSSTPLFFPYMLYN